MNLAPSGAASVILPRGRTVHSTTPIPRYSKTTKDAQLSDHPLKDYSLKALKQLIGINETGMILKCINLDESQYSKRVLAWCNQRFNEAIGNYKYTFGGIPIVNIFGDLGQLGPIGDMDLHVAPK